MADADRRMRAAGQVRESGPTVRGELPRAGQDRHVPDWAIAFVRRSAGRGADPLAVEALARRVAGLVGVFEALARENETTLATVQLRDAIKQVKKP